MKTESSQPVAQQAGLLQVLHIAPNSPTPSPVATPAGMIHPPVPWRWNPKASGFPKIKTRLLREQVAERLHETGHRVLMREAERIRHCFWKPSAKHSRTGWGCPCKALYCPPCGVRRSKRYAKPRLARMSNWAQAGHRIVQFVLTFPHVREDDFSAVGDAVLEAFRGLRRNPIFSELFLDYVYGVHCESGEAGPHTHVHVVAAMREGAAPDESLQSEIAWLIHQAVAPAIKRIAHKTFGEVRYAGPIPCRVLPTNVSHVHLKNLAYYLVKPVLNERDDSPFLEFTPDQLLDLFQWLQPNGRKRRLCGSATPGYRRRHGAPS